MLIRPLDPVTDRGLVAAFYLCAADYIRMERDGPPDDAVVEEFFSDTPPGCDPAASLRLGLFGGTNLIGVAEMGFGYPGPSDAYLGQMILAAAARGKGAGTFLLRHLEDAARARGAQMMYLAVLDANPKARAFWQREGFALTAANGTVTLGGKTQIAHRMAKPLSGLAGSAPA